MAIEERPDHIGNYTVQKDELGMPIELGQGAFAHVYLAKNKSGDCVAIKLLDEKHRNSSGKDDLIQEGEILEYLQQFQCPYILSFIERAEWNGKPYIVIQWLREGTLRKQLKGKPLEFDRAVTIITQIGEAISTLSEQNIVHCDITPENILFNEHKEAILTDFSIAIRLPPDIDSFPVFPPRGTPLYMAPEQFEGIITRWSDQYSLGCIAYELFTGTHPVAPITSPDINKMDIMKERHSNQRPEDPCIHNKLLEHFIAEATLKAIAKAPEERHEDVITFVKALRQPRHFPATTGPYAWQVQVKSPTEISTDLRLPENYFSAFFALLMWAGFKAEPKESVRSLYNRRWCTRVWEKSFESPESPSRALIYIPEVILVYPTQANRDSIGNICSAFNEDSKLIIVSKLSKFPDGEIMRIIEEDWPAQGKKGIILLWNYIEILIRHSEDIKGKKEEAKEREMIKNEIKRLLDWSNAPNVQPTGNNQA
jgi:serine/threonine protein kinase